jgi:hypothetical protein
VLCTRAAIPHMIESTEGSQGRRRQGRWWVAWLAVSVSVYATYALSDLIWQTSDVERIRSWFRVLFPFAALADATNRFVKIPPSATTIALYLQLPAYVVLARVAASRWRTGPAIAAVLALHASAVFMCGPMSGPSLAEYMGVVRDIAGPTAHECGVTGSHPPESWEPGLSRSREDAIGCATQALAEGRSFWVAIAVVDVDAYVYYALAARPGGTPTLIAWDSDGSGGQTSSNAIPPPVAVPKAIPSGGLDRTHLPRDAHHLRAPRRCIGEALQQAEPAFFLGCAGFAAELRCSAGLAEPLRW